MALLLDYWQTDWYQVPDGLIMWNLVKWYIFSADFGVLLSTWSIGIACIAVVFLVPSWIPFNRFYLLIGGVCLMLGGLAFNWAFDLGQEHMAQAIAAKDTKAVERIDRHQVAVDACNNGLDWDSVNGRCDPGSWERSQGGTQ